jgi:outer membrane protein TolC
MASHVFRASCGLVAAAHLAACAVYRPAPLDDGAKALLDGPGLQAAAGAASAVGHPRLHPLVIDLSKPLPPEALGLIAVAENPDLKAARAKAGVAKAQLFAAGLLPDPSVTLGADHILSGPDSTQPWLASVAYDLMAVAGRKTALGEARAARDQARLDLAWQEWQTAGQARLLAARIAALARIAVLSQAGQVRADAMLQRVLGLAAGGDVKADEVETRRLAAADAADKAGQAARDLAAAREALNALLGLPPETALRIEGPAPAAPPADAEALFARARDERLDLAALRAGYASQEAGVRKAVLDQFPGLQLTVTRQQDTTDNQLLGAQVAFTLPLWNRNRGGIAVAKATRDELRAEYQARLFATRAEIADLVAGLRAEEARREEIEAQIEPLTPAVEATRAAAARGDVAGAVADAAEQSLSDKAQQLAALDQAIGEQTVALELAVGAPLTAGDEAQHP